MLNVEPTIDRRVTRAEIHEAIRHAFGRGAVRRDNVVAAARASQARREVIDALEWLPALRYPTAEQVLRQLPSHLLR